jgi:hypothetical protein
LKSQASRCGRLGHHGPECADGFATTPDHTSRFIGRDTERDLDATFNSTTVDSDGFRLGDQWSDERHKKVG